MSEDWCICDHKYTDHNWGWQCRWESPNGPYETCRVKCQEFTLPLYPRASDYSIDNGDDHQ